MMPMTGVPLPFISYGGSFTLCLMVSIVFVQRVCIETRIREEEKNKKSKICGLKPRYCKLRG